MRSDGSQMPIKEVMDRESADFITSDLCVGYQKIDLWKVQ